MYTVFTKNSRFSRGFTFVELVVSVSVLSILMSISVMQYRLYTREARNTARMQDLEMFGRDLSTQKQQGRRFPLPWDAISISTGSLLLAQAGYINSHMLIVPPYRGQKDPQVDAYYRYSIFRNGLLFSVGATLETDRKMQAYIRGNYAPLSPSTLPSIIVATSPSIASLDISQATDRKYFVRDGSALNLPYDITTGLPVVGATSLDDILNEAELPRPFENHMPLFSCEDVGRSGMSVWAGNYILKNSATGENMPTNCCQAAALLITCP